MNLTFGVEGQLLKKHKKTRDLGFSESNLNKDLRASYSNIELLKNKKTQMIPEAEKMGLTYKNKSFYKMFGQFKSELKNKFLKRSMSINNNHIPNMKGGGKVGSFQASSLKGQVENSQAKRILRLQNASFEHSQKKRDGQTSQI